MTLQLYQLLDSKYAVTRYRKLLRNLAVLLQATVTTPKYQSKKHHDFIQKQFKALN